jgi:hypothetical protein
MASRSKNTEGSSLDWQEVNTEALSKPLATLYATHVKALEASKAARGAFDEALEKALRKASHVPEQMFCVIAHKWGKVSYAITEEERTKRGGSASNKITV